MEIVKQSEGTGQFADELSRWNAVQSRVREADGSFFYAVITTGIYCRPVCPARRARRENVSFYETCGDAERAGFRPCKRCKPTQSTLPQRHGSMVERACRSIEQAIEQLEPIPSLELLARAAGLSQYHFHRIFKAQLGVTPKAFSAALRAERLRAELSKASTITDAIYTAGYGSSAGFYQSSTERLGMKPGTFRQGGSGLTIWFRTTECSLGLLLVASTNNGVAAILFGDDIQALRRDLRRRFPNARVEPINDADDDAFLQQVVALVENPATDHNFPLDIRGTAFQQLVWQALRSIPAETTITYTELAARIGHPKLVRAVANACGANALAVAIPCHRVIASDGGLAGYRWGVARKETLLRREKRK